MSKPALKWFALVLLLTGCADPAPPMTNSQMAEAIAECKRYGLRPVAMETLSSHEVVRIICKP